MHIHKDTLESSFRDYAARYGPEDPKIALKLAHSLRVADLSESIAASVPGADPQFAWITGLVHDIGRFEQVSRFHTFVDADSVDHAELGADLLFQEGLLQRLGLFFLKEEERQRMETAIRCHNAYRIPEGMRREEQMYCDILRDADKVDIFRVLWDTPPEKIYDVSTEALRTAAVTESVKDCFRKRRTVPRRERRTPADTIVSHICLFFGLVYPLSRRLAEEQGYLDRLLDFSSENPDTARWFADMREHIRIRSMEDLPAGKEKSKRSSEGVQR